MIKKVDWILPMCGDGTRTQSRGPFKPLIILKNRPLFEHFISQLKFHIHHDDKLIILIRSDHNELFDAKQKFQNLIKKYLPNVELEILILNKKTSGPVETIEKSINALREDSIISIVNPDQIVDFKWPSDFDQNGIYLALGFDNTGKSSYVGFNENGKVKEIAEKKLISFYASVGVYIFGSKKLIEIGLNLTSKNKFLNYKNEQYISHLIQLLIEDGIDCYPLETTLKFDLGNISCIDYFESEAGQRRIKTKFI
tara:strand:+ start:603 stop:1364 length:762 start_codon:yes stop_codon:yes gene_type:complete